MRQLPGYSVMYFVLWLIAVLIFLSSVYQIAIVPKLEPIVDTSTLIYHCYWKGSFNDHHLLSLLSLINTQPCSTGCIYLWTRPIYQIKCQSFIEDNNLSDFVTVHVFDEDVQARGTILAGSSILYANRGITEESDKVRLLVLHNYGGLYFDLDVLFIKNMSELYTRPFVYQWSFKDYANTAIMFLGEKQSVQSRKLMKRVIEVDSFHPQLVFTLKACKEIGVTVLAPELFDPLWIDFDSGLPSIMGMTTYADFFEHREDHDNIHLDYVFPNSYTHHWHNCWDKPIKNSSIAGMFLIHHMHIFNTAY